MSIPEQPFQPQTRIYARRAQVIDSVRSPIGFLALFLLIVDAFCVAAFFAIPELRVISFIVGIFSFLLVLGAFIWLVIKYPTNLIFGERSQLEFQAMQIYGQREAPITGLELQALPVIQAPAVNTPQLPASESEPEE